MNILYKKSYCELCKNSSCSDVGIRNIHFMDHNHCSSFDDGLVPDGFVKIPGGDRIDVIDEKGKPIYIKPFYMAKYLVTVEEFHNIIKTNTLYITDYKNKPMTCIYWEQAMEYANKTGCRLPTMYEWECACGPQLDEFNEYSWTKNNSNNELQDIGKKKPSFFDLYDMFGNVWEFTSTPYDKDFYIAKGGSYNDYNFSCTPDSYLLVNKRETYSIVGFRLVKDIK